MSSGTYNIEEDVTLASNGFTPEAGYAFDKWKVTSVTDGNWTANSTFEEGETVSAGKYGNVTMTALWKSALADITINVTGLAEGETVIFTVEDEDELLYTVSVTGKASGTASVTIKDLPTGKNYYVKPNSNWGWAYNGLSSSTSFGLGASGKTCSFTVTKKDNVRKHDEQSQINCKMLAVNHLGKHAVAPPLRPIPSSRTSFPVIAGQRSFVLYHSHKVRFSSFFIP